MKHSLLCLAAAFLLGVSLRLIVHAEETITWWPIQSVDTMKQSRDQSRNRLNDSAFEPVIAQQVKDIADLGATHVAVGTPYDDEFIPMLDKWVSAARGNNLRVWFRGNFSGWEKWFGYPTINRAEHLAKLERFISSNPELFADNDIFSTCPECENGGPGDPRQTGDIDGHRKFLIDEYKTCLRAFEKIAKRVKCNFFSMNGDVARLIMDRNTTAALDGIVVIDHYVADPDTLARDISEIAATSGGRIVVGEMGAPIPDLHGEMDEAQQDRWVSDAMARLAGIPSLIGVNYWLNIGGSTALWNDDGSPRPAAETVKRSFNVYRFSSTVTDQFGRPLRDVRVTTGRNTVQTGWNGSFSVPYSLTDTTVTLSKSGFSPVSMKLPVAGRLPRIILYDADPSLSHTFARYLTFFWDAVLEFLRYTRP